MKQESLRLIDEQSLGKELQAALASPEVPHIYVNGFANMLTNSDVVMLLRCYGSAVAVLSMSYTTAKTLAQKLSEVTEGLEQAIDQTIVTIDSMEEALSAIFTDVAKDET